MKNVVQRLCEELNEVANQEAEEFTNQIFAQIIYDFHKNHKRKITYDTSGFMTIASQGEPFQAKDYQTIGDFLLELGTSLKGSSSLRFVAKPETFGDYYEEELSILLHQTMRDFLDKINDEDFEVLAKEIYKHIPEGYERAEVIARIAVFISDFDTIINKKTREVMNIIKQSDFSFWYRKLSSSVLAKIEQEEQIRRQQDVESQLREYREKQLFSNFWNRFAKSYQLMYREQIPSIITLDKYDDVIYLLKQMEISQEEMNLLVKYGTNSISENVVELLQKFQI